VDTECAIGPVAHFGRAALVASNKKCIIINENFY